MADSINSLINKTFVINYDKSGDRWTETQIDFEDTGLQLTISTALDKEELNDDLISNISTQTCSVVCSDSIFQTWISHYRVWKQVVKGGHERTLILEDYAVPVKNFSEKLLGLWDQLPKDWDILFLGCQGSCDQTNTFNDVLSLTGKDNKFVSKNVFIPGYPTGLYGYMLSLKGAQKLVKAKSLKKINFHLDHVLAKNKLNLNIYALSPPLIFLDLDKGKDTTVYHEILEPVTTNVKISENQNLNRFFNQSFLTYRPLGFTITPFMLTLSVISLMVGLTGKQNIVKSFAIFVVCLQLFELSFMGLQKDKVKVLIVELILWLTMLSIGLRVSRKIKSSI